MVEIAQPLAPFLRRPPTPPRESTLNVAEEPGIPLGFKNRHMLDTPEQSPSSSAEFSKDSSGRIRKRVDFSGFYKYDKPPPGSSNSFSEELRPLPPSRESKPTKSILKAAPERERSAECTDLLTFDETTLPAMLRSAVKHLASDSRASRLDAYRTLLGCLSKYQDEPTSDELETAMLDLSHFLKRDVSERLPESTTIDMQLVSEALKLCGVFLESPNLANSLPDEFKLYMAEKSIASLDDEKTPKILTTHYMHLLEKQKFSTRIMTAERVSRLLNSLHTITNRVKSSRVLGHRLMIYYRLLSQNKAAMVTKVNSWLHHLIKGLLSPIKLIRVRAIALGIEAGVLLGTSSTVSKTCLDILNHGASENKKVVELLRDRMDTMVKSREDPQHVPQIWSTVMLLLRSRRRYIEGWEHLRMWIKILEECFNSLDPSVKLQANIAWSRLIFAVNVDTETSEPIAKMLKDAIAAQLQRYGKNKASDKNAQKAKQFARNSYCTLLYYAMRPTASHAQLDKYWDLYIAEFVGDCFTTDPTDVNYACEIIAVLLRHDGQPRVWMENKANMSNLIQPQDIPSLDPKWVRSRASKIMPVFDKLYHGVQTVTPGGSNTSLLLVWRNLICSVAYAGSKEIKVSGETRTAVAQIVNQLNRILNYQVGVEVEPKARCENFSCLLTEVIARIDGLALNERCIIKTAQDSFESVSETPSSRHRPSSDVAGSAVSHLLQLILDNETADHCSTYAELIPKLVQIALQSTNSRHGKLLSVRHLAHLCHPKDETPGLSASAIFWRELAIATKTALQSPLSPDNNVPQCPGHDYRDAAKILELGIHCRSVDTLPIWLELYGELAVIVERETSGLAVTLMLALPVAAALNNKVKQQLDDILLTMAAKTLSHLVWPQTHRAIERTYVQLWGANQAHSKSFDPDLAPAVCQLIDSGLKLAYASRPLLSEVNVVSLISAATTVINASQVESRLDILEKMQSGLAVWVEDAQSVLAGPDNLMYPKVKRLWALVASIVERISEPSSSLLPRIDVLITACLRSRHRTFLRYAVTMWNQTFGCEETLGYSESLQKALLKVSTITDIEVPGFVTRNQEECSPFRFVEPQGDEDEEVGSTLVKIKSAQPRSLSTVANACANTIPDPKTTPSKVKASPLSSSRRSAKTTPKARLRHDNSQIQFTAVESSPLGYDDTDTQMLTARQMEVKARQVQEAAMFPEFIASPKATTSAKEPKLPKLTLNATSVPQSALDADEDTSPTFPPEDTMDAFLGSSPTPSSSRNRSQERHSDDEPVSSPPFISSHLQLTERSSPEVPPDSSNANDNFEYSNHTNYRKGLQQETTKDAFGSDTAGKDCSEEEGDGANDANIFSDQEVFVDAPSEPLTNNEASEKELRPSNQAERSSIDVMKEQSDHSPQSQTGHQSQVSPMANFSAMAKSVPDASPRPRCSDDDQAAAQLSARMEGGQCEGSQISLQDISKVRANKRKASSDMSSQKRQKTSKNVSDAATDSLYPTKGQLVADCVLIETRPVNNGMRQASVGPVIKRERSETPPAGTILSRVEETPLPGRQRPRKRRVSGGSRSSSRKQTPVRASQRKKQSIDHTDERVDELVVHPRFRSRRSSGGNDAVEAFSNLSPRDNAEDPSTDLPLVPDGPASKEDGTPSTSQQGRATREAEGEGPATASGILAGFRSLLSSIKQVSLRAEEERAMVGVLFESVQQVHEAGRRLANR